MKKNEYIFGIIINTLVISVNAEDKWIWSTERKNSLIQSDSTKVSVAKPVLNDLDGGSLKRGDDISRLFSNDNYDRARYEVQEIGDYVNGKPIQPYKPKPVIINNRPINRPLPSRPDEYVPLPSAVDAPGVLRQPPGQSVGILTGPIPSWEKPVLHKNGDPTNFEHCKCSFSFNCKSPGIMFGSCDQGKQYCCYNEFNAIKDNPTGASTGFGTIDRYDRLPPVLIGPGGPVDKREEIKPILPSKVPPRGHNNYYKPYSPYVNLDEYETFEFNKRPYPIIPQKPVLPPYMGLHSDYRSS